jgi:hypothetical protein
MSLVVSREPSGFERLCTVHFVGSEPLCKVRTDLQADEKPGTSLIYPYARVL